MPFSYKGLSFSDASGPFVRHMASLNDHRETLKALQSSWDTLALLGHLSTMKADMGETRGAFDALTGELMATLADETLARATSELGYRAQVAIDILTRNLFERTADIGFLATDAAVVQASGSGDASLLAALRGRFRTYAQRYTVYRDIVLVDPRGRVLVRMADGPAGFGGCAQAPLVARAAQAKEAFVEHYGETDFCGGIALTYSSAVGARPCTGVLSLVFDLDDEARRVFERLAGEDELIAFVDAKGRVVASNDGLRLPHGARAPAVDRHHRVRLGGQTYVAVRREPQPYQGYAGPGWSALALMPAELAFEHASRADDADSDGASRFSGEGFFSERLLAVPRQAAAIQGNLDRVVWNGHLQPGDAKGNDNFSRALLQEIAATGRRTKSVFEAATGELLHTVTATVLDEARFLSGLAVEILDRNLYERACDCRWWAENATLVSLDAAAAADVLAHINSLYTVYTNILLFDASGRVLASSRDGDRVGQVLDETWVGACLGLRDPMGYAVSAFEATPLYEGRSTYVYAAPIRDASAGASSRAIGGVGLVFDSGPQFETMLAAALPARAGSVGAFVRPDGTPVSTTGALPFTLGAEVLGLAPGDAWSGIVTREGRCYAVGATAGSGYREFKTDDGYTETVIAVIVVPCGLAAAPTAAAPEPLQPVTAEGTEVGTFHIGSQCVGLPAAEVLACIDIRQAVRLPGAQREGSPLGGYASWQGAALPLVDLAAAFGQREATHRHALVLQHRGLKFGLLVSELGAIVALQIAASPTAPVRHAGVELVTQIARSGAVLLPMLSAARVAAVSVATRPEIEAAASRETAMV